MQFQNMCIICLRAQPVHSSRSSHPKGNRKGRDNRWAGYASPALSARFPLGLHERLSNMTVYGYKNLAIKSAGLTSCPATGGFHRVEVANRTRSIQKPAFLNLISWPVIKRFVSVSVTCPHACMCCLSRLCYFNWWFLSGSVSRRFKRLCVYR